MSLIQILKNKNPDYKQELLWLDLKKNLHSIKSKYNIEYDVDEQTNLLNELQSKKMYEQIDLIIIDNLVQYSKFCLKFNDTYHKFLCYKHMKTLKKIINIHNELFLINYQLLKLN
tara:strand:+ start:235 stop:579 length:345 start_codon:yes stop_codon:yes gene_type:complete